MFLIFVATGNLLNNNNNIDIKILLFLVIPFLLVALIWVSYYLYKIIYDLKVYRVSYHEKNENEKILMQQLKERELQVNETKEYYEKKLEDALSIPGLQIGENVSYKGKTGTISTIFKSEDSVKYQVKGFGNQRFTEDELEFE
jgi:hypothetical protein